jgi:hypothetical protein
MAELPNSPVTPDIDADEDRRKFLASCGKFAVVTPPVVTLLLSTSLHSSAIAHSAGGSSHDRGHKNYGWGGHRSQGWGGHRSDGWGGHRSSGRRNADWGGHQSSGHRG